MSSSAADQPGRTTAHGPVWNPSRVVVGVCLLLLVWVTVDLVLDGPWHQTDLALADWIDTVDLRGSTVPNAVFWLLSQTGGRGTILVVVGALTLYVMRLRRVWQPLLRLTVTFILLTTVVYALKVGLGRTAPGSGDSILYVDGLSYPSGHSTNAVLWWGTAVWLVRTYRMPPWLIRACTTMAIAAPVLTTVSMIALNYHWLSDVVAGLALGLILLWSVNLLFSTRLGEWGNAPSRSRSRGEGPGRGRGRSRTGAAELVARPGPPG